MSDRSETAPAAGSSGDPEISRLTAEIAHWKANATEMAARNAVLRDRPDLPVDRLPALARLEKLFEGRVEAAYRRGVSDGRLAPLDATGTVPGDFSGDASTGNRSD